MDYKGERMYFSSLIELQILRLQYLYLAVICPTYPLYFTVTLNNRSKEGAVKGFSTSRGYKKK